MQQAQSRVGTVFSVTIEVNDDTLPYEAGAIRAENGPDGSARYRWFWRQHGQLEPFVDPTGGNSIFDAAMAQAAAMCLTYVAMTHFAEGGRPDALRAAYAAKVNDRPR